MPDLRAHHTGVTVSNLEEMLPFYRDVLGFQVLDRFSVSGDALSEAVGVLDASATFVHLEAHGIRLELVEYEPEGETMATAALNQPGAIHLGLLAPDVEAFYAALPADVQTLSSPQTTESGATILFLRDPEDNLIEVLQP